MKNFLTSVILVCSLLSFSQEKEESLKEMKASKLYVALYDTSDVESSGFGKSYNNGIRAAFSSRWNFCPVEYITFDKIDVMKEKGGNEFVMIPLEYVYTVTRSVPTYNYRQGGTFGTLVIGRAKDYKITKSLTGKNKAATFSNILHKVMLSDLQYISLFLGVDMINRSFNRGVLTKEELKAKKETAKSNEDEGPARAQMKTKTLLVDKNLLEKGLTEATIKSVYHHPVKVTDFGEIKEALKVKNPNILFFTLRPATLTGKGKDVLIVTDNDLRALGSVTMPADTDVKKENFEELNKIAEKD